MKLKEVIYSLQRIAVELDINLCLGPDKYEWHPDTFSFNVNETDSVKINLEVFHDILEMYDYHLCKIIIERTLNSYKFEITQTLDHMSESGYCGLIEYKHDDKLYTYKSHTIVHEHDNIMYDMWLAVIKWEIQKDIQRRELSDIHVEYDLIYNLMTLDD